MANSILNSSPVNPTFRIDGRKSTSGLHSANSSVGASTSDPVTPFSTGATPPSSFKAAHLSFERTTSQTPMSTSPERYRNVHRSSSNLASAFAASISRPFSFSASVSTSPPMAYPRKRLSPAQSYLHTSSANTAIGQGSVLSRSLTRSDDPKFQYPPSVSDLDEESSAQKEPLFMTRLKNQDQFQNDGHAIVPLLNTDLEWRYHAYRGTYAHLLSIWDLPIKGCEILHYHSLQDQGQNPWRYRDPENAVVSIGRGNPSIATTAHGDKVGLELKNVCSHSGEDHALQANKKNPACSRAATPLICLFCASIIRGLSSPCLNCGHALHVSCRALSEQSQDAFLSGECISGCGCYCSSNITVEVAIPSALDDKEVLKAVHVFDAGEPEPLREQDTDEGNDFTEDETWEDVAYESLARNLGGRSLTPKPSQIWRGEGRKRSVSVISSLRRTESR
ncbi:MAG: hypothetical protein LQ342_002778 [Letrouitia transgressa]|nr:MAG: hypothetical protein LQ342_002778 [Letrouitia transgressa]